MIIISYPVPIANEVEIVTDERSLVERWFGGGKDKIQKLTVVNSVTMSNLVFQTEFYYKLGEELDIPDFANRCIYRGVIPISFQEGGYYECTVKQVDYRD